MAKAPNTLVYAIYLRIERKSIIRSKIKKILLINITASLSLTVILRRWKKEAKSRENNVMWP